MNKIFSKFFLAGEKIQPQFTYNTLGLFTTHGEMIKYSNETGYLNYLYQNELDRSCFAHSDC